MKTGRRLFCLLLIVGMLLCCFALSACGTGEKGDKGDRGDTGATGEAGKSAYELYKEVYGYEGTEEQWLEDLAKGNLANPVMHTVYFDPDNGESIFRQSVEHGEKVRRPNPPSNPGYRLVAWVYDDGVTVEDWSFGGYTVTKDITLKAVWEYATDELPIININTNGEAIDSKEDYTSMTFSMENCGEDELIDVSGGIRLRGNSTMGFPKKPYRIKFDKKQSLFGLEKAKSWVLLAEYIDPSALHNYTAFSLASAMPGIGFTPTPHKVNVYLNGTYAGLYTLCEQVQENEGRMNIEMDEITADMTDLKDFNFFVCMDKSVEEDPTAVYGETFFYVERYEQYFELKYPEKDQFASTTQFRSFMTQLQDYIEGLLDTFAAQDVEAIRREVNVNSLVDYLIVDQIMGERDHAWKSFNMYYTNTSDNEEENGKLNFGPVWDYDWALHTSWTGQPNESFVVSDEVLYSNLFFKTMSRVPEFYDLVKQRYTLYAKDALANYIDSLDDLVATMEESIAINQERWYSHIDEDLSVDNIRFLKAFLQRRKTIFDNMWRWTA